MNPDNMLKQDEWIRVDTDKRRSAWKCGDYVIEGLRDDTFVLYHDDGKNNMAGLSFKEAMIKARDLTVAAEREKAAKAAKSPPVKFNPQWKRDESVYLADNMNACVSLHVGDDETQFWSWLDGKAIHEQSVTSTEAKLRCEIAWLRKQMPDVAALEWLAKTVLGGVISKAFSDAGEFGWTANIPRRSSDHGGYDSITQAMLATERRWLAAEWEKRQAKKTAAKVESRDWECSVSIETVEPVATEAKIREHVLYLTNNLRDLTDYAIKNL